MAKIKKKAPEKGGRSFVVWMTVVGIALIGSYVAFIEWKSRPHKVGAIHELPLQKNITSVEDPVCGMMVKPPAAGHVEYRAKHYYFCSESCKEDFEKDPRKHLEGKERKEMK
jgi:YHS domain-containing protein